MDVLVAQSVKKTYKLGELPVRALDGVDFVVRQNEFVSIMGPSGSGKSTLLHLLGGLDRPSDGEILLAGKKLSVLSDNEATLVRRNNIGFIFQFYNLLPTLSAAENILLPIMIDGRDPRKVRERLDSLLQWVGLEARRDHKPDELSGGEQQRVSIARALITEPAIVLADEPTGNLDTKTGTAIMELLRRSRDEWGQTVIVVTHDPGAASYADRVVFLRDGHIADQLVKDAGLDQAEFRRLIVEAVEALE